MAEISPALAAYDIVEPVALKNLSKVQLVDQNKGAKATGEPLKKTIESFYFTDVISRRSVNNSASSVSSKDYLLTMRIARRRWHGVRQQRRPETPGRT
jgi:NADH dehydrogenase (ubiquinone) Fe-S protein 1